MDPRKLPTLAALALLGALAAVVPTGFVRGQDEDEPETVSRGFAIPQTREARALAERAEGHLAAQRWSEAFTVLQELLTLKSDDIIGRAKTYEAIVKGDNVPRAGIPESFNVLVHELQGLGLNLHFE